MKIFVDKYRKHKELINNFFWRALQIISKQGTILLIFFISAICLSREDFGLFNYLIAIVSLLMIFCDFGLSSSVSKYSTEHGKENDDKAFTLLNSSILTTLGLASFVCAFILFFGERITGSNFLLYFIPYIFLYPITSIFDGYYRGAKKFKKISIITLFAGLFSVLVSFVLISKYHLLGAIISQSSFFALLFIFFFISKERGGRIFDKKIAFETLRYGIVIGVINILFFLYTKVDIIFLKHFGFIVEIGRYEIVNKVFAMMLTPFIIIGQVMAPNMTRLYSNGEYEKIKRKFWKYVLFFSTISILISVFIYFLFPVFLKMFLIDYFDNDTMYMFKILLLLFPLNVVAAIINHAHTIPTGNAKFSMWTMIPAGIANVFLDFLLIKKYGFIGVIYSTMFCYIFATISFMILYYLKIDKMIKVNKKYE